MGATDEFAIEKRVRVAACCCFFLKRSQPGLGAADAVPCGGVTSARDAGRMQIRQRQMCQRQTRASGAVDGKKRTAGSDRGSRLQGLWQLSRRSEWRTGRRRGREKGGNRQAEAGRSQWHQG